MSLILISPYRYVTAGGGGTTLTDIKPAAGTDDGFFDSASGFQATDIYNRLGEQGGAGALCTTFARFVVNVPQGATITAATVKLRAFYTASRAITTQVEANDVDNATAPTSAAIGQGLARTTANVSWVLPDTVAGSDYSTPDISSVIQEVVDRAGWVANNNMTILLKTTVAAAVVLQDFHSYEQSSTVSLPRLTLTYT